jgi:NAD(P)-dependent dehydrogenase (short-subunit alcohol dehydrogenase family)
LPIAADARSIRDVDFVRFAPACEGGEMADMGGKTCVITGATSGIGFMAAVGLAAAGARLVLVGRDRQRGEAALARLKREAPTAKIEIHYADLTRLDEVRRLASMLDGTLMRIDVLLNNAGALFWRRSVTGDGLERTFALNHMAYFMLTELLRGRLVASAPARVVSVASEAHRRAELDFADLQGERRYNGLSAYERSKLCNILHTRELARRFAGTGVTANCVHPGFVASRFGDDNGGLFKLAFSFAKRMRAITPERGAQGLIYLASSPDVAATSGAYFNKRSPAVPSPAAQDDRAAERLWQESARLAGLA